MPKRGEMTDAQYAECVRLATEIKREIYGDLDKELKEEELFVREFMRLSPEEREARIDSLILLSKYQYQAFKAAELVVKEYWAREMIIRTSWCPGMSVLKKENKSAKTCGRFIKWYARLCGRNGLAFDEFAGHEDDPERRLPSPVCVRCGCGGVWPKILDGVRIWRDCARPDSALYKHFPPLLRRC